MAPYLCGMEHVPQLGARVSHCTDCSEVYASLWLYGALKYLIASV